MGDRLPWKAEGRCYFEPFSFVERARLKELEKQVKELNEENEFLLKASAFFAKLQR
jgi:transposase